MATDNSNVVNKAYRRVTQSKFLIRRPQHTRTHGLGAKLCSGRPCNVREQKTCSDANYRPQQIGTVEGQRATHGHAVNREIKDMRLRRTCNDNRNSRVHQHRGLAACKCRHGLNYTCTFSIPYDL